MELIQLVRKNQATFLHKIYVLKILIKCTNDTENMNKLEYVERIYSTLNDQIDNYAITLDPSDYNMLDNDYHTIESLLVEIREEVVPLHKITTVLMLDNMKVDEIMLFYEEFINVYSKYNDINVASTDIFYYSGKEIASYIISLLKYINSHDVSNINLIPVSLLEERSNVITLSMKEWLQTIQIIKTTLKYLSEFIDGDIETLRRKFITLNVYYFIVITGGNK